MPTLLEPHDQWFEARGAVQMLSRAPRRDPQAGCTWTTEKSSVQGSRRGRGVDVETELSGTTSRVDVPENYLRGPLRSPPGCRQYPCHSAQVALGLTPSRCRVCSGSAMMTMIQMLGVPRRSRLAPPTRTLNGSARHRWSGRTLLGMRVPVTDWETHER
jgi:hypothetical protein